MRVPPALSAELLGDVTDDREVVVAALGVAVEQVGHNGHNAHRLVARARLAQLLAAQQLQVHTRT